MCFHVKSAVDDNNGEFRKCGLRLQLREAFKALNLNGTVFEIDDYVGNRIEFLIEPLSSPADLTPTWVAT